MVLRSRKERDGEADSGGVCTDSGGVCTSEAGLCRVGVAGNAPFRFLIFLSSLLLVSNVFSLSPLQFSFLTFVLLFSFFCPVFLILC